MHRSRLPWLLVLLGCWSLVGLTARAQEAPPAPPPGPPPTGADVLGPAPRFERERPGLRAAGANQPGGDAMREAQERLKNRLLQEEPETYRRLMDLKDRDPAAYRQEVRELMARRLAPGAGGGGTARPSANPLEQQCQDLARQFQQAKTPEESAKLRAELTQAVKKAFDAKLSMQEKQLEEMETRLKTAKEQVAVRQGSRDKICDLRVEELTRDAKLKWNPE